MTSRPSHRLVSSKAWTAAALVLVFGCGASRDDGVSARVVPPGAFALVGTQPLVGEVLQRVLGARDPQQASENLIVDARLALESAARHPDRAAVIKRGILMRALVDALRKRTLEEAPPRPEELEAAAQALWADLDRPRSVRTVSVMLEVPPLADGENEERVMRRIASAVRGAPTPDEFSRRVQATDVEGLKLVAISVPPLTEDGRVYVQTPADAGRPSLPVEYAQAAARLSYVGEISELVTTSIGYHVLMAIDIFPAHTVQEPERGARLRQAVADRRLQSELERLRTDLAVAAPVWRSPHQAALTSLVWRTMAGP